METIVIQWLCRRLTSPYVALQLLPRPMPVSEP